MGHCYKNFHLTNETVYCNVIKGKKVPVLVGLLSAVMSPFSHWATL